MLLLPLIGTALSLALPQTTEASPHPQPAATNPQSSDTAAQPEQGPPRGELKVALGLAGGASNWSGDFVAYGDLKLGLRLFGLITPFVQGRLGYGTVDTRLLTFLSAGIEGGYPITARIFPRGFVAFVHQHEESMAAVAEGVGGALLGIGTGIRHRAGVQFGLGADFMIHQGRTFQLTLGPEATAVYLTYSSGPHWYGLLGASLCSHFRLF